MGLSARGASCAARSSSSGRTGSSATGTSRCSGCATRTSATWSGPSSRSAEVRGESEASRRFELEAEGGRAARRRGAGGGPAGRPGPRRDGDPALRRARLEGAGAGRLQARSPTTPAPTASRAPAPEGGGYSHAGAGGDLGPRDRASGPAAPGRCWAGTRWGATPPRPTRSRTPTSVAGVVLIRPASAWGCRPPEESLAHWDRLADGLESERGGGLHGGLRGGSGGVPGVRADGAPIHARAHGAAPRSRRAGAGDPRGAARRSRSMAWSSSSRLGVPALVVASHDEADPGPSLRGRRGLGGVAARPLG